MASEPAHNCSAMFRSGPTASREWAMLQRILPEQVRLGKQRIISNVIGNHVKACSIKIGLNSFWLWGFLLWCCISHSLNKNEGVSHRSLGHQPFQPLQPGSLHKTLPCTQIPCVLTQHTSWASRIRCCLLRADWQATGTWDLAQVKNS